MRRLLAVLAAGVLASAVAALPATPAPAAVVDDPPPSLSMTPTCTDGTPSPVQIDGDALSESLPYEVRLEIFGDPGEEHVLLEGEETNAEGAFHETAELPAIPAGQLSRLVVAVDTDGFQDEAWTWVWVCPTLSPTPAQVDVGSLPRPVTITGSGWYPDAPVQISLGGVPGPVVNPDSDGNLVVDLPISQRPCRPVAVTGVQEAPDPVGVLLVLGPSGPTLSAATSIQVICPPPTTPPPSTPPSTPPPTTPTPASTPTPTPPPPLDETATPTLTVDPLVMSGGVGMARGAGFQPGATVVLTWALPSGTKAPGGSSVVADAQGRFVAQCLVLPRAMLGPRSLQAVQAAPSDQLAAAATTLVVSGPMEPGRNRLLGRR